MQAGQDSPQQGFVLVEILVALSIVAVMGAMMAGVLGQMRAVGQIKEQVMVQAELAAAAAHLQRTIEAARRAPLGGGDEEEPNLFEGEADALRFAGVTRQGFRSLALRDVHIRLEAAAVGARLVQTMTPRRPQAEPGSVAALRLVVLETVDAVEFGYSRDGRSYLDEWEEGRLPRTVRITLSRTVQGRAVTASAVARLL